MEVEPVPSLDAILHYIYYNPDNPVSFSGVNELFRAVDRAGHHE